MATLHLLLLAGSHPVVSQVVKPELGVGSVGDVTEILFAPDVGRLVMKDATHGETKKPVNSSHPLAVAGGQIVVHRHNVNTTASESIQVNRQGCHQSFAFTGGHFSYPAGMKCVAANQLHIKRDHFPRERVSANNDVLSAQAAAGVLDHGERLRKDILQPRRKRIVVSDLGKLSLPGRSFLT